MYFSALRPWQNKEIGDIQEAHQNHFHSISKSSNYRTGVKGLKMLTYYEEECRSFHTFNIGSVGQRAAKLLAVKV